MKTFALVVLVALFACTKPNPNRCCTDEADCMAAGIPVGTSCGDGLLCRGNQCIAVSCSANSECDASAPFCINSSCTETCTADDQCPGFGATTAAPFCVSGACAQCREGAVADCSGTSPICDGGACRACKAHTECPSGVCSQDGACAPESDIAYVAVGASDIADCSRATMCSLTHGLSLLRRYLLLQSGTYTQSATVTVSGTTALIGSGPMKPAITNSAAGSIIAIGPGSDVTLQNLQIRGATGANNTGIGVLCKPGIAGSRRLHLVDVDVSQNSWDGFQSQQCTIEARHSTFTNNGNAGFAITDGDGIVDSCLASGNVNEGFKFDVGLYTVRNSFAVRNSGIGMDAYGSLGSLVEFNTVADNLGGGLTCGVPGTVFPNNLLVRNGSFNTGTGCTYPGSFISDVTTGVNFKSADVMPYDYHLSAGSIAIDAATTQSMNKVDYDGDARPQGAAKDVGADEYKP